MTCNTCGGGTSPTLLEFRDLLQDHSITVHIRQRETWANSKIVVMFDSEGTWHIKKTGATRWEMVGTGLDSLKETLRGE